MFPLKSSGELESPEDRAPGQVAFSVSNRDKELLKPVPSVRPQGPSKSARHSSFGAAKERPC